MDIINSYCKPQHCADRWKMSENWKFSEKYLRKNGPGATSAQGRKFTFWQNTPNKWLRKSPQVSSFLPFSTQKRFRGRSCQAYSFRDTDKCFRRKRCRIKKATKLPSRIFKIFGFWPPKNIFFLNITAKNLKCLFFNFENGIYVIVLIAFYSHTKFEINTSFLAKL